MNLSKVWDTIHRRAKSLLTRSSRVSSQVVEVKGKQRQGMSSKKELKLRKSILIQNGLVGKSPPTTLRKIRTTTPNSKKQSNN